MVINFSPTSVVTTCRQLLPWCPSHLPSSGPGRVCPTLLVAGVTVCVHNEQSAPDFCGKCPLGELWAQGTHIHTSWLCTYTFLHRIVNGVRHAHPCTEVPVLHQKVYEQTRICLQRTGKKCAPLISLAVSAGTQAGPPTPCVSALSGGQLSFSC